MDLNTSSSIAFLETCESSSTMLSVTKNQLTARWMAIRQLQPDHIFDSATAARQVSSIGRYTQNPCQPFDNCTMEKDAIPAKIIPAFFRTDRFAAFGIKAYSKIVNAAPNKMALTVCSAVEVICFSPTMR